MARRRIGDIAAEAHVSPATVSKYLNGHFEAMSTATRERVARVIERTGYRPSSVARNLRLDRSRTLGVILADIRNPFSSAMLEKLSAQAAEQDYALTCAVSGNDPAKEAAAIERLLEAGADGLIVNTCGGNDGLLIETDRRAPVVLLDRDIGAASLDLVTSNNQELMRGLVDALVVSGARDLHLLGEHSDTSSVRRERTACFISELARRDLAGAPFALDRDAGAAAGQLQALCTDTGDAPLGLIAVNGLVFQRLIEAIARAGIAVPAQARLATFDEYPWNRVLFGGVTCAAQDTGAIAAATLQVLENRIVLAQGGHGIIREDRSADSPSSGREAAPPRTRIEVSGTIIARASTSSSSFDKPI